MSELTREQRDALDDLRDRVAAVRVPVEALAERGRGGDLHWGLAEILQQALEDLVAASSD